jgi:ubiquinone/menaquinone biosynthesis C-methylase UbiE
VSRPGDSRSAIESTLDPDWFIRFVSRMSARPGKRHPARALLDLGLGERCLDLGCGIGDDARAMAEMAGAQVVAVDLHPRMLSQARSRSAGSQGLTFLAAESDQLPFRDSTFDAAWIKRPLLHLSSPATAVSEMARVVKAGGRVVVVEPDLEAVLLDSTIDVTRRVLAFRTANYARSWAGRQLRQLMLEAGLANVRVIADPTEITNLADPDGVLRLVSLAGAAAEAGVLTEAEASRWTQDLRRGDGRGLFVGYVPGLIGNVAAR